MFAVINLLKINIIIMTILNYPHFYRKNFAKSIAALFMRLCTILFFCLCSLQLDAQTEWDECCKGYENGYKKGFSYPDLAASITIPSPPCNCIGIIGTLNYEVGFIKGYEDGKKAKQELLLKQENKNRENENQRNKTRDYNVYIDPNPYAIYRNNSTSKGNSTGKSIGIFSFFPEAGASYLLYRGFYDAIGVSFKHDLNKRLKCELGYSTFLYGGTGTSMYNIYPPDGLLLGLEYNFNKNRPVKNKNGPQKAILNPVIGTNYIHNIWDGIGGAFNGSAGIEFWSKDLEGASVGIAVRYIKGTKNINVIQISIGFKITK